MYFYARSKFFKGSKVRWDQKLARLARTHAEFVMQNTNCAAEFNENNSEYGENLFWAAYEFEQQPWNPMDAVAHWMEQVSLSSLFLIFHVIIKRHPFVWQKEHYNWKSHKCNQPGSCEAFIQVIWRNTTRIGCGEVCAKHEFFGFPEK